MSARILFVSHSAEWMGPTHSLRHLVDHLVPRYEVTVLCPGDGPFREALAEEGVRTLSLPKLDRRSIPSLYRIIRDGRFQLVYGNNTSRGCRNALIAARMARVPFICHVRGMGGRGRWRKLGFLRFADAVVAVSEACARGVERYAGSPRLHVVHNGVNLDAFASPGISSGNGAARERPEPEGTVISVAHVCPRKGQHHAVEAMARVAREMPAARLLLVGAHDRDPAYVERLRARIGELDLASLIHLPGFQPDVRRLLLEADVFLHTALEDPHPRSVLEAMAAGLPVVAFDVDGVSETVVDGSTGFLFPSGDVDGLAGGVRRLLRDPGLRRELGARGRERAEREFSAAATGREVERIIRETLESAGSSVPLRAAEGARARSSSS